MAYLAKTVDPRLDLMSLKNRQQLTKITMRLLDEWELSTAEQLTLLGLRETSRNMLSRYRNLESSLPYDQDKLERVGILLAIYKNLYDLFPENENLRKSWVKRENSQLDNACPLDMMLTDGLFGMAHIMRYLDLQLVH
jgi:uncharacterized protein (DUF2384 family)